MEQKHFSDLISDFPFVEEPQEPKPKLIGKYQKWKYENKYQKSTENRKCCKFCKHCYPQVHHMRTYYKCDVLGFSHGSATDVRLGYVCNLFEV